MKIFAVALFVGLVAVARAAQTPREEVGVCYNTVTKFCKDGLAAAKGECNSKRIGASRTITLCTFSTQ